MNWWSDLVEVSPPLVEPRVDPSGLAGRSVFRAIPWRWRDLIIGLSPLVLIRLAPWFVAPQIAGWLPAWGWIGLSLIWLGWMVVYPCVLARRLLGPVRLVRPRSIAVEVAIAVGVALPLVVAMGITTTLARFYLGSDTPNPVESIARSPTRLDLIALGCLAIGLAPLAEELMYRGLVYNGLRRRLPTWFAAPLTAVVFAACHPFGLADSLGIALAGLVFALVYEWRQTLLAPILVHTFQNAAAVAVLMMSAAALAAGPVLGVAGVTDLAGVRVTQVAPKSAATIARLQVGDIITAIDDTPTPDFATLTQTVRTHQPGDLIRLRFRRNGEAIETQATLKPRSDQP